MPISANMCFVTVTDLNDFNGRAQTTNLGVRSSNLFGRAICNLCKLDFVSFPHRCSTSAAEFWRAIEHFGSSDFFRLLKPQSGEALATGRVSIT
jgi:hypothetical protein